ncbi:alpha/beta hydrolase [Sphingomonas sp. BIUV-7]|uniref:Alpha/beta hydrolase n=1 Tax=Sphingomonas natans TaxID=3063330 RepID=A0ABT8YB11_9SPHN|nr:alpha/beta hydrolase [Sphingomonas sp. BIUV-7]MDO6415506.1 alpha/beta hydrolase [Sphingomonas sp. BIUV-7]
MTRGKVAATALTIGTVLGAGYLFSALARRRSERIAPATGHFVTIDGVRLHYLEAGDGPPILLIHGLGGQLRHFSYALLEKLARRHRVIMIDRPGAGHSARMRGYGIAEHAAIVARFIETLALDHPIIAAHSFGGAVALSLALDHPELVGKLALIAPLSQPDMVVQQPFKTFLAAPLWLREMACRTAAVPIGVAIRGRVHRATFAPEAVAPDFDAEGGGLLVLRPETLAAGFEEISTASTQLSRMVSRYPEITVPVSILFGREDQVLDPAIHGERTALSIAHSRLAWIEGGHMLPVTQPDAVARFILEES